MTKRDVRRGLLRVDTGLALSLNLAHSKDRGREGRNEEGSNPASGFYSLRAIHGFHSLGLSFFLF